ncbi:hypothetical protein VNO78_12670 [Psophocarpus tetragonolobus]|uniref:DUF4005 domain-containing protein n=1 Tax=Psophocarpus tetragonolobus TaxID=3891 RepID=A0AAN9SNC3_PSOTE
MLFKQDSSLSPKDTRLSEAEEEHNKHALTAAIASAAAAEAAISAAQVAVEVVRLQSSHQQFKEKQEQLQPVKTRHDAPHSTHQCKGKIQEYSPAIKIQTAYRDDSNSERRWDDSILLKEVDASCIRKKEARSSASERNERWRNWMGHWVDTQLFKSKELEDLDSIFNSHYSRGGEESGRRQLKLRNNQVEALYSPFASRRFSPHRSHTSEAEDHSFPRSPLIPAYMAATKSTQAKARSTSFTRTRTMGNFDMNSDGYPLCIKKVNFF